MLPFRPSPTRATVEEKELESATSQKQNLQLRHDAPQIRLAGDAADAENWREATTTAAVPVNPDLNMHLAVYRAPSVLSWEDQTSSGGPSLVPPTLATLDNVPIPQPRISVVWPELPPHLKYAETIRNIPLEIEPEGLFMSSTAVTAEEDLKSLSPLPWKSEFRWESGALRTSRGSLESAPYSTITPVQPSTRGEFLRRLVKNRGSGGGEDDDPDGGDDNRFRPPAGPVLEKICHFACPFQKWRPQIFKRCRYIHRNVSEVKTHVQKKHYVLQCPECHGPFKIQRALKAHYTDTGCGARPTPDATPGRISEQQLAIMWKRPFRQTQEQQWRNLWATLLPNEPQPRDIYFSRRAAAEVQHIAHHPQRCSKRVLRVHRPEQAHDNPFSHQFATVEAQCEAVAKEYTTPLMYNHGGQEISDRPPPLDSDSQNYFPSTVTTSFSVFPPDISQSQSLAHGYPLMLDSPGQNHSESTGLHNLEPLELSHVPQSPPGWHIGSQFSIQPINLSDINHAALGYQPITTRVVEQQPPVLFQPRWDFDAQFYRQPNEDFIGGGSQYMFQPGPHSNSSNNNRSINQAIHIGTSTVAEPPIPPRNHGLAPTAVASGSLFAPMSPHDTCDNTATTALGTFRHGYMQ